MSLTLLTNALSILLISQAWKPAVIRGSSFHISYPKSWQILLLWHQMYADSDCFSLFPLLLSWSKPKLLCVLVSHVQLFVTPRIVAHHTPMSVEFSRQEYWSGLPFSSPGDLLNSGIEPGSPTLLEDLYCLNHWGSPSYFTWIFRSVLCDILVSILHHLVSI